LAGYSVTETFDMVSMRTDVIVAYLTAAGAVIEMPERGAGDNGGAVLADGGGTVS